MKGTRIKNSERQNSNINKGSNDIATPEISRWMGIRGKSEHSKATDWDTGMLGPGTFHVSICVVMVTARDERGGS